MRPSKLLVTLLVVGMVVTGCSARRSSAADQSPAAGAPAPASSSSATNESTTSPIEMNAEFTMSRGGYTFKGNISRSAGPFVADVANSSPGQGRATAPVSQTGSVENTTPQRNADLNLVLITYLVYPVSSPSCTISPKTLIPLDDLETGNQQYCVKMIGYLGNAEMFTPGSKSDLIGSPSLDFSTLSFPDGPEADIPSKITAGNSPAAILLTSDDMTNPVCTVPIHSRFVNAPKQLIVGAIVGDCSKLTT